MNHFFHESTPSAVVVACVVFGLLVTFLLFGLFDGWTHSTSPNPFRPPCHGRWQVLNLNKEVTNTVITIISIQSVTQLKVKHAPNNQVTIQFWLQNKQLITRVRRYHHLPSCLYTLLGGYEENTTSNKKHVFCPGKNDKTHLGLGLILFLYLVRTFQANINCNTLGDPAVDR